MVVDKHVRKDVKKRVDNVLMVIQLLLFSFIVPV